MDHRLEQLDEKIAAVRANAQKLLELYMSETDSRRKDVLQTVYEVEQRKELTLMEERRALMAQRALETQMVLQAQLTGVRASLQASLLAT